MVTTTSFARLARQFFDYMVVVRTRKGPTDTGRSHDGQGRGVDGDCEMTRRRAVAKMNVGFFNDCGHLTQGEHGFGKDTIVGTFGCLGDFLDTGSFSGAVKKEKFELRVVLHRKFDQFAVV